MPEYATSSGKKTKRELILQRKSALNTERSGFIKVWRNQAEYIAPRRYRYLTTDRNRGDWLHGKIIDNTATMAVRTLKAGMMSGHTSPWRPWFRLAHPDPDLNESPNVRAWLYMVTERMRRVYQKSNLYNALPMVHGDKAIFGQAPLGVFEDFESVVRYEVYPIGSYWISTNDRNVVDTFIHQRQMTTRQIVEMYGGYRDKSGSADWSNFSTAVKTAYDNSNMEQAFDVLWATYPNEDYDASKVSPQFKRYVSCHLEVADAGRGKLLRESGFDRFPILCPRWDVTGEDAYGYGPGWECLGDVKALQTLHRRVMQADDKMINPALQGPGTLKQQGAISQLPGHMNWIQSPNVNAKIEKLIDVQYDTRGPEQRIAEHQYRIKRAFNEDLFLLFTGQDDTQRTATEIAERKEEKLWALGPVLERDNDELHDPNIDRTFEIMLKQGFIPEPPEEIQGERLVVQYTSIMAQAQALVGLRSTDRFLSAIGGMAGVVPEVLDKVDIDATVDEYAEGTGVNPRIVRSTEKAMEIRAERAAQQQADADLARSQVAAQGAKTLSEADTAGDNALTRLLGGVAA